MQVLLFTHETRLGTEFHSLVIGRKVTQMRKKEKIVGFLLTSSLCLSLGGATLGKRESSKCAPSTSNDVVNPKYW